MPTPDPSGLSFAEKLQQPPLIKKVCFLMSTQKSCLFVLTGI